MMPFSKIPSRLREVASIVMDFSKEESDKLTDANRLILRQNADLLLEQAKEIAGVLENVHTVLLDSGVLDEEERKANG